MNRGPGLVRREWCRWRRERLLPLDGEVQVRPGQRLAPDDVVATAVQPGAVVPVNVAHALSLSPTEVSAALVKGVGATVHAGDVIARTKGLFGLLRSECLAPCDGRLAAVSRHTGQIMIEAPPEALLVHAFVAGKVAKVIPNRGAVVAAAGSRVQGIFGVGPETWGELVCGVKESAEVLTDRQFYDDWRGKVILGGGLATREALAAAADLGVAALVIGGVHAEDLEDFLGYDVALGITGGEDVPFTLVMTEGFGPVAMEQRAFNMLRAREGAVASVTGETQIRAGVLRPEILIPWAGRGDGTAAERGADEQTDPQRVRIVGDPYFGHWGHCVAWPAEPQQLPSGMRVLVAVVTLENGSTVTVPRANLEWT